MKIETLNLISSSTSTVIPPLHQCFCQGTTVFELDFSAREPSCFEFISLQPLNLYPNALLFERLMSHWAYRSVIESLVVLKYPRRSFYLLCYEPRWICDFGGWKSTNFANLKLLRLLSRLLKQGWLRFLLNLYERLKLPFLGSKRSPGRMATYQTESKGAINESSCSWMILVQHLSTFQN